MTNLPLPNSELRTRSNDLCRYAQGLGSWELVMTSRDSDGAIGIVIPDYGSPTSAVADFGRPIGHAGNGCDRDEGCREVRSRTPKLIKDEGTE